MRDQRGFLRELFEAALAAAKPAGQFKTLPPRPKGRTIVLGAGKGSAAMAAAFEQAWNTQDTPPCDGLIVTRYGHACPTEQIKIVEAAHPVPDEAGREAAQRIFELAQSATADDLVVFLISGGASALLTAPAPGLAFDEKQAINRALLKAGAPIDQMNRVRQSLSAIKGGRLAAAASPARCITYVISDVPGDDPRVIGSGPTVPPLTDGADALDILARYQITVSEAARAVIAANQPPSLPEQQVVMLGTPQLSLEAAAQVAQAQGITPLILGDAIEGEAREVARVMAGISQQVLNHSQPVTTPCVLLSGGETTVTVKGSGRGGRNAEFLLAFTQALGSLAGARVAALAADTDGIDGIEDNAGAIMDGDTLTRAQALGLSALDHLDRNDAYSFFASLDDLVITGPTLTNVNDFRAILVT